MAAFDRIAELSADARYGCATPTATDIATGAWEFVQETRRYDAQAAAQCQIDAGTSRAEWAQRNAQTAVRAFGFMTADERKAFLAALAKIAAPEHDETTRHLALCR